MEDNEKNRNHEEGRKHGTERPKEIVQRLDKKGCGPGKGRDDIDAWKHLTQRKMRKGA